MEVFDGPTPYYPSESLSLEELAYWIAFSRVLGIGPVRFKKLLDFFKDDVAAAWHGNEQDWLAAGIEPKMISSFQKQRSSMHPQQELERLERKRIRVLTWKDDMYPILLKKIDYAPPVLYTCGVFTDDDLRFSLGIVGTRKMSSYGRMVTEKLAGDLARGKITIVSGLASGVDTIAHTTALEVGGRTIAVMASGLDVIYPPKNYSLARRIVESGQGVLVTPFPLGVKPEAGNFPARNHVISGLSLGVLVTEAPARSGSLITAASALQQGREVFAVPAGIFASSGEGVNKLIQDGAHPVTNVKDIIERLNLFMVPEQTQAQRALPTTLEEKALAELLSNEPTHIDDLTRSSQLPAHVVSAQLTTLELKGIVKQVGGMHYILVR